jgi:hypothetical protein
VDTVARDASLHANRPARKAVNVANVVRRSLENAARKKKGEADFIDFG